MKALFAIWMIVAASFACAAEQPASVAPSAAVVKGVVLEVQDAAGFTYLRLKTTDGETWAAVARTPVRVGAEVTIENVTVANNFESRSLKRNFQTIVFGDLVGAGGREPAAGKDMTTAHAGVAGKTDTGDTKVPRASGANARTVAEIITKGAELKDQPVLIRGKVVKYNAGIMGRNWIHLRDGSGSAADQTNDVLVTSANEVKVGDIVTMKGVVRTDKDFGSGYSYKVLVEEATLQRQ